MLSQLLQLQVVMHNRQPHLSTTRRQPTAQVLPAEIGRLSRLKTLRVRRNKLQSLPPALAACSSLLELHAGFNAISSLPEGLGSIRGVVVLEVRNNLLQEFPAALCGLPLTLLDLTANRWEVRGRAFGRVNARSGRVGRC